MQPATFDPTELRATLTWYLHAKNRCLIEALRLPNSQDVSELNDVRFFYSQYLVSMLSAVGALLEQDYPHRERFRDSLRAEFVVAGFPDGARNYAYLRELRNAVIHRGQNLTEGFTVGRGGMHLFHLPSELSSRDRQGRPLDTYQSFSPYLFGMVLACEHLLCPLMKRHLEEVGVLQLQDPDARLARHMRDLHERLSAIVAPEALTQVLQALQLKPEQLVEVEASVVSGLVTELCFDQEELPAAEALYRQATSTNLAG